MMSNEKLKEVMKFQLGNFNENGVIIDDNTIHNDVLSEDDGFAHINSKHLYKDVILFTLIKKGYKLKRWPENWLYMSVSELAAQII